MKPSILLLFLAPALCLPALFAGQDPQPQPRADWIEKDVRRAREVRVALARETLTVEQLRRDLGACDVREDRDLGFGVRRVRFAAYGGYTTVWIDVFAESAREGHASAIGRLRVRQAGACESWPIVAPQLAAAWGEVAKPFECGVAVERRDARVDDALRRRTLDALGGPVQAAPAAELAAPFALLSDPLEEVIVGLRYGDDGAPPPGFEAAAQLARAGRADLLRAVLRSPNAESRVYAAHALLARRPLDARDAATIEVLAKSKVEIVTSEGCSVVAQTWDAALAVLDED